MRRATYGTGSIAGVTALLACALACSPTAKAPGASDAAASASPAPGVASDPSRPLPSPVPEVVARVNGRADPPRGAGARRAERELRRPSVADARAPQGRGSAPRAAAVRGTRAAGAGGAGPRHRGGRHGRSTGRTTSCAASTATTPRGRPSWPARASTRGRSAPSCGCSRPSRRSLEREARARNVTRDETRALLVEKLHAAARVGALPVSGRGPGCQRRAAVRQRQESSGPRPRSRQDATAVSRPCAGSRSRFARASASACSVRTARARPPRSRSSRACCRPTSGEVEVLGRRWGRDDREIRERLGVCLQQTVLSEKLEVGETLSLFRSFYRDGARPARGHRGGGPAGEGARARRHALGRAEAAAGGGLRAGRRPGAAVPRRADDRPRPAVAPPGVGDRERLQAARAARWCSPPTTWTRPRSCATASPSSTTAGSSPRARRAS